MSNFINDIVNSDYSFILYIAIILLSTKFLGLLTRKVQMPQVVGALIAGVLLGPAVLNIVKDTDFISGLAEIGVIVLMFGAGLETDVKELKKTGVASFVIALIGVLLPLVAGFGVAVAFDQGSGSILKHVFIGIILTATSVSITVETLKELGKLNSRAGNAILGAAIIDDVLGIIGLTIVMSMADASVNISIVLIKIVAFFVFAGLACFAFHILYAKWSTFTEKGLRRYSITAFAFCLLMSFIAEYFFGVADITGAYIAGLAIAHTKQSNYVEKRFNTMSYLLLSPIFFASIGLKVEIGGMTPIIWVFAIVLTIVAILTKIVGCGLGAKLFKYTNRESVQIGVGMISRGEVALIIASKGDKIGLMPDEYFGPIVLCVIVTTIITPVLLKVVFKDKNNKDVKLDIESKDEYETIEEVAGKPIKN